MKYFILIACILVAGTLSAKGKKNMSEEIQKISREIEIEGMLLYRSEAASWFGTDIFLSKYSGDKKHIGGYFSYPEERKTTCIFFSESEEPKVIATITFDTAFSKEAGVFDNTERSFSAIEREYFDMRQKTIDYGKKNKNFKYYNNTKFNIAPLIDNAGKRVYVMTATDQSGLILFGNDYLINFNADNTVSSISPLHRSLIQCQYSEIEGVKQKVVGYSHTHLPEYSPFITATDICITKLYEKLTSLNSCTTVSDRFISRWNGKSLSISKM